MLFKYKLSAAILFFLIPALSFADSFQLKLGKLFAQGKTSEAAEAIQKQLDEDPEEPLPWLELAGLDKSQGDYSGAVAAYQNYLAQKDDWKVRVQLALAMEQMGKFADASIPLHRLDQQHPNDPELLWGLARLGLYQSQWKSIRTQSSSQEALRESQKYLIKLVDLKPHFSMALWELAEVSRMLGDRDRALRAYEDLLKKDGSYRRAHRYIAELLFQKGRVREALAKFEQAMAVEPDDPQLRKESREASLSAPRETQRRQSERMDQWEKWEPSEAKGIAPSAVTVRVGLFTDMGHLLFRGQSDLQVMTPAQTPLTVLKAGIDYDVTYIRSKAKDLWVIRDAKKKTLLTFSERVWVASRDPQKTLLVHAVPSNTGYFFAREEDRAYRGLIEFSPHPGKGFNVINRVTLEDYCAGVLPSEMSASWPIEALKAQAIVVRTYVLSKMGSHNADGFDVVDSVRDQVYRGLRAEQEKSNEAVRQTAGLVLEHRGKMMPVVFSAECGGRTQDYGEAWGFNLPVVGVEDYDPKYNQDMEFPLSPLRLETWIKEDRVAWCRIYELKGYQNYRWTWLVTAKEIEKKIPGIGHIRRLTVPRRSTAGWAGELLVEGELGNREFKADIIRRYLGGIRSNLIWIEPQFNPKGWPEEFMIYGGGWGHGVGMCQVGCYGLAKAGKDCGEILRHYFPKGSIEKLEK